MIDGKGASDLIPRSPRKGAYAYKQLTLQAMKNGFSCR